MRTLLCCLLLVPLPAIATAGGGLTPDNAGVAALSQQVAMVPSWQQMNEAQRRERRAHYAAWRALSEPERQRVREAAARFAALPPARQQALREQFMAQDQAFRDGWRLGPLLGEYFGRLQGLFGFVPPQQRQAILTLLRQLDREQVALLALVAQRTPPQEREAVRTALLAVPAAQRGQWLKDQASR